MRVVIEPERDDGEAAGILAEWRKSWLGEVNGKGIELAEADSLPALLDLRKRCYDRSVTVTVFFPDNR